MKLYEKIENNNFDEIDKDRAIELIENGNGHLVYNENYFKLQKENEELKIVKSAIQTLQINSMEDEKYIVISKSSFFDGSYKHLLDEFIPIPKVKDNIEKEIKYHEKNILDIENVNMLKSKTAKEEAEIEFNKYAIVVLKKMLQELIEEREEKAE